LIAVTVGGLIVRLPPGYRFSNPSSLNDPGIIATIPSIDTARALILDVQFKSMPQVIMWSKAC